VSARSEPATPWWVRRPEVLHVGAYAVTALVLAGQLVAVVVTGSDRPTVLAVLLAGAGAALSWWRPWPGLLLTGAASFAVTAVGRDPLSVWMMAVLVLFSVTLRGGRPVVATAVVALCQLGAFMTVGGFRGGGATGVAALFSALAGGATGAGLRVYQDHWWAWEQRAEAALATREIEATRRVGEERLRIARDLHDVVAHQVAMLSVHLGVAEIGLPEDAEEARRALASARSSSRTVIVETQRILSLLRRGEDLPGEEALRPTPALGDLQDLIASFEATGLHVDSSLDLPRGPVDAGVGVTVYRVVQEGLTNAHRHGGGAAAVEVHARDGSICVTVENSVGPAAVGPAAGGPAAGRATGSGLGLLGMRERVESSGGRLDVDGDGQRFRVRAELPTAGAVLP
jgi:signal transduction histidine kinase